jgi:hypothetical protein
MKTSEFKWSTLQELAQDAVGKLNDGIGLGTYGADLHNDLFNSDYYIIGRYQAEQWLIANTGVFNAIGIIHEYENMQFGEVSTDLSEPERVCNMIVYIAGEEVLQESETLQKRWNEELTERDIKKIIKELKNAFSL